MRVAICDDNRIFLEALEQQLLAFPFVSGVVAFSRIDCFFASLRSGEQYDLVMMDIDWGDGGGGNGISYGEQLYTLAAQIPLIYVTAYNDRYAQQVLLKKSNLVGYLTKPVDRDLLEKYLRKVMTMYRPEEQVAVLTQGGVVSLDSRRIVYVESQNHITIVHTETMVCKTREKLSELFLRLPDTFLQCHKSYAVNMHWVRRMVPGYLILRNGQQVPISRSRSTQTREEVFRFMGLQI